jgi:peptidoglycan/xylan/chitin deacetylase (PgdA/CDA1 family)
MIGENIVRTKKYNNIYKTALTNPLITIGNHTYTHARGGYKRFYYSSKQHVVNDLIKTHNILIKDNSNSIPYARLAGRNVFRLPTIFKNDIFISKKQSLKERKNYDAIWNAGFYLYGWDYEWEFDYKHKRPKLSVNQIVKKIERLYRRGKIAKKEKFVLLLHDPMFKNRYHGKENLQKLIKKLKNNGWQFDTIANYLDAKDFLYAKYQQHYDPDTTSIIANNIQVLPSTPIKKEVIKKATKVVSKNIKKPKVKKHTKKPKINKHKIAKKPIVKKRVIKHIQKMPYSSKDLEAQLFEAINRVDEKKTQYLIKNGVNIHAHNSKGQSALVLATMLKRSNIVQILIKNGADINKKDKNGNSALMILQQMTR